MAEYKRDLLFDGRITLIHVNMTHLDSQGQKGSVLLDIQECAVQLHSTSSVVRNGLIFDSRKKKMVVESVQHKHHVLSEVIPDHLFE